MFRRLLKSAFYRSAPSWYKTYRRVQNKVATISFGSSIGMIAPGWQVRHPTHLINPQYMKIGANFIAEPGLRMEAWDAYGDQEFSPSIVLGDNVIINYDVHIGAISKIEIGNDVLIGSRVLITDHSHGQTSDHERDVPARLRPLFSKGPVIIEDNVWIGEGACILANVKVGKNAIIGANAVVTHDVAQGQIVAGVPATVITRPIM